jgi:hypothetical protein
MSVVIVLCLQLKADYDLSDMCKFALAAWGGLWFLVAPSLASSLCWLTACCCKFVPKLIKVLKPVNENSKKLLTIGMDAANMELMKREGI